MHKNVLGYDQCWAVYCFGELKSPVPIPNIWIGPDSKCSNLTIIGTEEPGVVGIDIRT